MSLKVDKLQLEIIINNDQARKQLRELNDDALNIQKSMKGMVKGSDEYVQASQKLEAIKKQMDNIKDSIGLTGLTMKELTQKQKELNQVVSNIDPRLPQWKQYKDSLDQVNARIKELKGNSQAVGQAMETQGGTLGGIKTAYMGMVAAYAAVAAGGAKVISFMKDSVQAYLDEERANARLLFALNGNTEATARFIRFKDQLTRGTMFSKDEIESAVNMGIELGRTELQTRKMIETAMGMSRVTGKDLKEMMLALSGTYEGQTGRLGKLAGELKGLTEVQLKNGEGVEILNAHYVKFLSEGITSMEGGINLIGKAWERIKEKIIGPAILKSAVLNFGPALGIMLNQSGVFDESDYVGQTREKIKAVNDNIAAMREQAKKDANVNTYIRDLDKKGQEKDLEDMQRKAQEYSNKLIEIRKKLEDSMIQLVQDEREKELKLNNLDLERQLKEITGNSKEENELRDDLNTAALIREAAINKKYDDKKVADSLKTEKEKWEAIIKADDQGSAEWYLDSKTLLEKMQEMELNNTTLTEQQKLDIKEKYLKLQQALDKSFISGSDKPNEEEKKPTGTMASRAGIGRLDNVENIFDLSEEKKQLAAQRDAELASAGDSAEKQAAIWKAYYAALREMEMERIKLLLDSASIILGSLSSLNSAYTDYENAQLAQDQQATDQKKANLESRLQSGLISQKEYDSSIARLDADLDAKKRQLAHDQAVRNKEIAIMNAIISTAVAIVQALTIPIVGEALAIIVGLMGAAQVALIIATPVPGAAEGRYNVIGEQDGKLYKDVPNIGTPKTGLYTKPFLGAESGREIVIDNLTTENLLMNYPEVIRAINYARTGAIPQRFDGEYPQDKPGYPLNMGKGKSNIDWDKTQFYVSDPRHTAALEKFNEHIERGIVANVIFDDIRRQWRKIDDIENDAGKTS